MPARIIVAEDNPDAREMLCVLLSDHGFEVVGVEDGRAAIDAVRAGRPDLIITDIQMPHLDGIEMIKELRTEPEVCDVPILVMTANHSGAVSDALDAGANAAAQKPLELGPLIDLVKSLLGAMGVFLFSYCSNMLIESVEGVTRLPVL
ncbi:MAG TPA: response regulator [Blastocatellia bacterium]|nr:response regulator [Blastocatellia bacterium]